MWEGEALAGGSTQRDIIRRNSAPRKEPSSELAALLEGRLPREAEQRDCKPRELPISAVAGRLGPKGWLWGGPVRRTAHSLWGDTQTNHSFWCRLRNELTVGCRVHVEHVGGTFVEKHSWAEKILQPSPNLQPKKPPNQNTVAFPGEQRMNFSLVHLFAIKY